MKFTHCLHIVLVIGKCTDSHQRRGDFLVMDFLCGEYLDGMKLFGSERFRINFTRAEFAKIRIRYPFHSSYATLFLHVKMLWKNWPGKSFSRVEILWGIFTWASFPREKFSMGEISPREIFHGQIFCGRNFHWGEGEVHMLSLMTLMKIGN